MRHRLTLALALATIASDARAEPCPGAAARVASVQGTVEAKRAGTEQWQVVRLGDVYCPGDTLRLQVKSRADVALADQSVLRLRENTTLVVEGVKAEGSYVVDLVRGAAHVFSRHGARELEVKSPYTVAGVRGTEFAMEVDAERAVVRVFEGHVVATSPLGSVDVTNGQTAIAAEGQAPVVRVEARPRDAVRWALYYVPVLYLPPSTLGAGRWQAKTAASAEALRRGDLKQAFDLIGDVDVHAISDPRFFAHRASLLLAVGSVEAAGADIDRALALAPSDADALALQTVIALAQNENDLAFAAAERAVGAHPTSATARIALSYAQQARFDLEGARTTLEETVRLEPENALAWARLAELQSSFGEGDAARAAAERAAALEPNLARTQTVLGFARLAQVETEQARAAFERAIVLDSADPLPHLGMGLAKIRDGDLDKGGRDIEIAASLDPSNALVRSYLGKVYYEEKRTGLDEREYATAKELDPRDPTPWFYDAIAKQTTNRPVEALTSIQKAIALNDNRAVYRSRLLLDADLAARSASLGRIYGDLGFQAVALAEGWHSVNIDPTNFSAHRFLADSYAALPRHEIARVSELLQSQLLQPINITPIQPRLAESNLFLVSAGGPGAISFNEFNPLFNRNRVTVQSTGVVGEHDTFAGEGVVAGVHDKLSFSAGYTHFSSEGFRTNNDQQDAIADAFVQAELTPRTSVQAEYRHRDLEKGDLALRFFPEDFHADERQTLRTDSYRVGARHVLSPSSIVLGSFIYQDLEDTLVDRPNSPPVDTIDVEGEQQSAGGEVQHLFRSRYVNTITGVGHFHITGDDRFTTLLALGGPLVRDEQDLDRGLDHTNAYLYSYLRPVPSMQFTVGVSADVLSGESALEDETQLNPKVGFSWAPFDNTTLRAAAFRSLKRTLITDQTLEPTQVAGFNQFYDDGNGTNAWRYGVAVDQKFSARVFGGLELSARDLEVPFLFVDPPASVVVRQADWQEKGARAYLLWAPHDWLALRLEYFFDRFDRDRDFTFGLREANTHRVPLGMGFFHPSGMSASLTTTYFHQDGVFEPNSGEFRSGSDDFVVVDAGISYRLPRRYGFISVGVTNLFDEKFRYHDLDFDNPIIQPDRVVLARVTLSLW